MAENRICAVTELCAHQANFTRVSIASFIECNPWFDGTIYLLCTSNSETLQPTVESIRKIYLNIVPLYIELDEEVLEALRVNKNNMSDDDRVRIAYLSLFKLDLTKFLYFSNKSLFLKSVDSILTAGSIVSHSSSRIFYFGLSTSVKDTSLYSRIKEETLTRLKNGEKVLAANKIEQIVSDSLLGEGSSLSSLPIDFSSRYKNNEINRLRSFLAQASVMVYDSFLNNQLQYSTVNTYWLAKHKKISQYLNSARSFISEPAAPGQEIKLVSEPLPDLTNHKLAVLIHCYYYEIMPDLKRYVDLLPEGADIFINVPESVRDEVQVKKLSELFPGAKLHFSENRGRDVGGFISLWSNYRSDEYTSVLLLHTKKSPHLKNGDQWRGNLLTSILGNREIARKNAISINPKSNIGIIGSARHRNTSIGLNKANLVKLNTLFGVPKHLTQVDYLSGTIMFISPLILDKLCSKLNQSHFQEGTDKDLKHHMDGQLEHAVERFFATLCRTLGKIIKYI